MVFAACDLSGFMDWGDFDNTENPDFGDEEDEELYGLGSHEEGYPSLKGKFVPLYQEKQYCLCSDRLEGVFLKKDCLYTFKNASITNAE